MKHDDVDNGFDDVDDADEMARELPVGVTLNDFHAYMPMHNYLYIPSREPWPATSVNARLAPVPVLDDAGKRKLDDKGKPEFISASKWLDQNRPV